MKVTHRKRKEQYMKTMRNKKHNAAWEAILSAIREKATQPGETQASVARLLGRDRATIHNWLSKKRGGEKASIDDILFYMEKLNLDPRPFFDLDTQTDFSGRKALESRIAELEQKIHALTEDLAKIQKEALDLYREREARRLLDKDPAEVNVHTSLIAVPLSQRENK